MQLGYTIPLQKYLKIKGLQYGPPVDLLFCWDMHVLKLHGHASLLAVNASNRYAFLLYDLCRADWQRLTDLTMEKMKDRLSCEGFLEEEVSRYFDVAGEAVITRTHGRRPVAFLNRAVEYLYACGTPVDESSMDQPFIDHLLNEEICHAAGHEGYGRPREFLKEDFKRLLQ